MRHPDGEILVMARAPVPGEAKTRLIPALGEEGAAALHAYLVERLLAELSKAAVAPITLCCTPDCNHPFFKRCRENHGVALSQQQGRDLGERMHHALATALATALQQRRYAVVIGCDIPLLNAGVVDSALRAVSNGADAAISPTEDDGYALLALQQPAVELFDGVLWGGDQVMLQTRQRLSMLGWQYEILDTLWDVDWPEDLQRLNQLPLPRHIEKLLGELSPAG